MPKQSVAVQTSPKQSLSTNCYNESLVRDIRPDHFTSVQTSKLEDVFSHKTKPDVVTMQILAMESNLLFRDVEAWFKERRLQYVADAEKSDTKSMSTSIEGTLPDVQC